MTPAVTVNYYEDSNNARRGAPPALLPLAALLALLATGCGASNTQIAKTARRVPVAHISDLPPSERAGALASLPVILEIRKGDTFPVEPVLSSALVALHTEGTWVLEANETFYVLLRKEGPPVVSADGIDFDAPVQNSFSVGFDSRQGQPTKVRVALTWHAAGERGPRAP
jgi:hypothetical protein